MSSCDGLDEPVAKFVDLVDAVGVDAFVFVHPRLLGWSEFDSQSDRRRTKYRKPLGHTLDVKEKL